MPEVSPPEIPLMTDLEKLALKRKTIHFANEHNMLYRDYGSWVALQLPIYNTKHTKEGAPDVTVHTAKDHGQGAKKSPRHNEK